MPKQRGLWPFVFYIIVLLASVAALWGTLQLGGGLAESSTPQLAAASGARAFDNFTASVQHHLQSTIGLLLLQILVILMAARMMGWIFRKLRQPAVIGEIVAGILLGPSLFGRLAPEACTTIFPTESLPNVQLLSNFGLILFMFVVGMELRLSDIRRQLKGSLIISHSGIFLPFVLSLPLSHTIYTEYAASYTGFVPFALFIGIAMSITAFPVLARIIQENNLLRTHLGKLSLSTAAAGDITAWLMLAAIITISGSGSLLSTGYNLLFLILYLLLMFGLIRPLFRAAGKVYNNTEVISHGMVGVIFILLLLSSFITELLSMHALFGAFMLGLVMPEDLSFRKIITDKVEEVALLLFLPLFFVSSGLQTELGLIDGPEMWILLGLFALVAVVGKVGGTYIAARACGESPKNSIYLGAFMNTRGLMELVVLGIGYEMRILPPAIYAVLVLMTVITTDQDINSIDADKYFADSFAPILAEAEQLAQPIETSYQISDKVESTILTKLVQERYNLLIVGAGVRFSSETDDQEAVSMREEMRRRVGAFSVHTTEALLSIHSMLRDKMQFFRVSASSASSYRPSQRAVSWRSSAASCGRIPSSTTKRSWLVFPRHSY